MNVKPLPVGLDNFEKLVTRGYYLVDKTLFIKELLDKKGDVNLFTRPRRFGKTLNMSMLQYFLEDARTQDGIKKDYSLLFQGLKIMRAGKQYLSHMGQYPVISLSFKAARQPDFDLAYRMLVRQVADEFRRHRFVMEILPKEQKARYQQMLWEKPDRESFGDALKFLSECLEQFYGKKVIVLIDEYDVPLENAYFSGFYEPMVSLLRSLFESVFKTNASLEFAVVT